MNYKLKRYNNNVSYKKAAFNMVQFSKTTYVKVQNDGHQLEVWSCVEHNKNVTYC